MARSTLQASQQRLGPSYMAVQWAHCRPSIASNAVPAAAACAPARCAAATRTAAHPNEAVPLSATYAWATLTRGASQCQWPALREDWRASVTFGSAPSSELMRQSCRGRRHARNHVRNHAIDLSVPECHCWHQWPLALALVPALISPAADGPWEQVVEKSALAPRGPRPHASTGHPRKVRAHEM